MQTMCLPRLTLNLSFSSPITYFNLSVQKLQKKTMASTISSTPTIFHNPNITKKPSFSRRRNLALLFSSIPTPLIALRERAAVIGFVAREGGDAELLGDEEEHLLEEAAMPKSTESLRFARRSERKKAERMAYLVAAMMSSLGFTFMAAAAVYYRFAWQMEGSEVPLTEMMGTFSLAVGSAVGMEYWARWAHRALWHASLWHMHESHHRPRDGPFELNDIFAIINAIPAIALLAFGFFNRGFFPGLSFGAGLGITLFGMAYMFVHDGLVHRRFPVGPIANIPYFQRVAAAHQIHHADKFNGVPYGLFLGHKELDEVGGTEELERELKRRTKVF